MVRSWLVAFVDDPRSPRRWWDVLCRSGFRHVQAWGWDADAGVWVVYSVFTDSTMVDALPPGDLADSVIGGICAVSSAVLRFEPPARPEQGRMLRLGFWCVPAVAHLLGIRTGALVPHQLYRDLLRRGATPAYEGCLGGIIERTEDRPGGRGGQPYRA